MRNRNPDIKIVDGVASFRRPSGMGAMDEIQRKIADGFSEMDRQAQDRADAEARRAQAEAQRRQAEAEAARKQAEAAAAAAAIERARAEGAAAGKTGNLQMRVPLFVPDTDTTPESAYAQAYAQAYRQSQNDPEAQRRRAEAERQRQEAERQRQQQQQQQQSQQRPPLKERKPLFVPNPPHWSLQEYFRHAANTESVVPRIYCHSGLNFSVQIGDNAYCHPRTWTAEKWSKAEIGFPNDIIPEIMQYAEDADTPLKTVYGFVPVSIIEDVIENNGGIDFEKTAEHSGQKRHSMDAISPDWYQDREENPSYVGKFERFFDGQIENRQKIGVWYVWDIGSPSGIHEFVGQAKDSGYQSAWAKHGQVGVLRSEVSDLGRSTNYGSRRNNPSDNLGEEVDDIVEEIETKFPTARFFEVYDSYSDEVFYETRDLRNAVIVLLKEQKRGNEIDIYADGVLAFSTP